MKPPLSPRHLLAAVVAVVAVGLSPFVLSGGAGSLPAVPHVPAAVIAAGHVDSPLAVSLPKRAVARTTRSRPAVAGLAVATTTAGPSATRTRPTARQTVRHRPAQLVVRRVPPTPVVHAAPAKPVSSPPAGKHGKQRGKSAMRFKGHRSHVVEQSHKKADRPAAPSKKRGGSGGHGDNGNHGAGNGDHGGGNGDHGGGNGRGGK